LVCALLIAARAFAQNGTRTSLQPEPRSATVPITLDHNRIVIDITVPLPDGTSQTVRGWVDNGNPDLMLSRRLATALGLTVTCDEKACSAPPPPAETIGGMKISLSDIKKANIPLKPVTAAAVMAPGLPVEINLPSTILRHYDVLVNFPNHEFTIAAPGTLKFQGSSSKMAVNAENGLVQLSSQIENKKYNLALDLGASISFLSEEVSGKLLAAHADWPHMTGAVGPANLWGLAEEPKWKLLRVERVSYGPLFLTNVPFVAFPQEALAWFEKRAGVPTVGLVGSQALLNYRIGLDYAHATVHFEIGRTSNFPDFDVVGLVLRPEDDGKFTILGIADYDGRPSVSEGAQGVQAGDALVAVDEISTTGSSMGQVWSMLGGTPGQERRLGIERNGKKFTVIATVQHFLGENENPEEKKKQH